MGMFSSSVLAESGYDIPELEDHMIEESVHEPNLRGAYAIIAENEMNYNAIMKAAGIDEIRAYTGMLSEAEEAKSKDGFFSKAKNMIIAAGRKILELIKRGIAAIEARIRKDEAFADKFAKRVKVSDIAKLGDAKGFKFTPEGVSLDKIKSYASTSTTNISDAEQTLQSVRRDLSGEGDAKEFDKAVFKKLRNGESEAKVELKSIYGVESIARTIKEFKTAKKYLKGESNTVKRLVKDMLNAVKDAEKKAKKDDDSEALKAASEDVKVAKGVQNIMAKVVGLKIKALVNEYTQARKAAVILISRTSRKGSEGGTVSESTTYMDSIELI